MYKIYVMPKTTDKLLVLYKLKPDIEAKLLKQLKLLSTYAGRLCPFHMLVRETCRKRRAIRGRYGSLVCGEPGFVRSIKSIALHGRISITTFLDWMVDAFTVMYTISKWTSQTRERTVLYLASSFVFMVWQNCGTRVLGSSHPHGNTRINTRLKWWTKILSCLASRLSEGYGANSATHVVYLLCAVLYPSTVSLSAVELSGDALADKLRLSAIACFEMTSCCFFCFSTRKQVAQIYAHYIAPLSETRVVAPNISQKLEVVVPLVQNICPSFYQSKSQVSPYKRVKAVSIPSPQLPTSTRQHIPPYANVDTALCFRNDPDNIKPPPSFFSASTSF